MQDWKCSAARWRAFTAAATLLLACSCGLLVAPAARAQTSQPNPEVRVVTNMGSFVIELRPDRAPLTVANFLRYVRAGFYTDTLIHRVVANFVIQGGGHNATAPYALKPTGPPVDNESGNGLENKRGTVGLARGPDPDSGTSQFYINLVDNPELDPLPTRWGYAVFGKVIQGMNVVEQIGLVPTGAFGPFKSEAPLTPIVIESMTVVTPNASGASPAATTPAPAASSAAAPAAAPTPNGSAAPGASGTPPAAGASSSPVTTPPAAEADRTPSKPATQPTGTPPPKK
ncbi:MAG: peptidylprolyl isomerase [Pseudomonadota bacterium]|jgi:cyclophilin family peptidyl-prolyl cis-trans isomerase|nr:peptidylprolyl isomerase [Pseudomonadota bacterium]